MKVILVAGGTGGHVFPAIALGEYLIKNHHEVKFIGVNGKMEASEVPKHHIEFIGFDARGFNGSITNRIKCLNAVKINIKKSKIIIEDFKADIVVGFGGYICVSVLWAAHTQHVPVMIHEQNSVAGLANKLLAKIADGTVICFEHAASYFNPTKTRLLGSPRASSVLEIQKDPNVLRTLNIKGGRPLVLIVMGSLGSESVNAMMKDVLQVIEQTDKVEVIYVSGDKHYSEMMHDLKLTSPYMHVVPFVDQLRLLPYLDLIVCRAGATTIAEISALRVPAILIPSPYVAHNHQEINASSLSEKKAAYIILEKELTANKITDKIFELCFDQMQVLRLKENMRSLGYPNATKDIVAYMEELISK